MEMVDIRVFLKGHFEKIKCTPHHITGGYLGRSYPEGEADQTSLGGWHWHLKFDKIGGVFRPLGVLIWPQSGPKCHIIMCYTRGKCFRVI